MNSARTLLILLITCLCCVNFSFALDLSLAKENLLKETKEYAEVDINTPMEDIRVENKVFNHKNYVFIMADVIGKWNDNAYDRILSCINILHSDKVIFDFCDDGYIKIQTKGNFWTLENISYEYARIESYRNKRYFTFRLINDTFYLYQSSKNIYIFDRCSDRFGDRLISSNIFYRQPRDDPKKENLIPLASVNDELLSKLSELCYEAGHCKEIDWEIVQELRNELSESCE